MYSYLYFCLILVFCTRRLALAANVNITLGANDDTFSAVPNNAFVGRNDTLTFLFAGGNHSVVESTFENPCVPKPGGFHSGFIPVFEIDSHGLPFYEVALNPEIATYWFSSQTRECQSGLVGQINARTQFATFYNRATVPALTSNSSTTGTPSTTATTTVGTATSTASRGLTTSTNTGSNSSASSLSGADSKNKSVNINGIAILGTVFGALFFLSACLGAWIYLRRYLANKKASDAKEGSVSTGFSNLEVTDGRGRVTGNAGETQEVSGWHRPNELEEDKGRQELETWERPPELGGHTHRSSKKTLYELDSSQWI